MAGSGLDEIPEFGRRDVESEYVIRPGAYGIIRDERGRLALVRTPGGVFLPGGGQDDGESLEETLVREIREETGLEISADEYVGTADELACVRGQNVRKRCAFFLAQVKGSKGCVPIELLM